MRILIVPGASKISQSGHNVCRAQVDRVGDVSLFLSLSLSRERKRETTSIIEGHALMEMTEKQREMFFLSLFLFLLSKLIWSSGWPQVEGLLLMLFHRPWWQEPSSTLLHDRYWSLSSPTNGIKSLLSISPSNWQSKWLNNNNDKILRLYLPINTFCATRTTLTNE